MSPTVNRAPAIACLSVLLTVAGCGDHPSGMPGPAAPGSTSGAPEVITGFVARHRDGLPVSGATVTFGTVSSVTGVDGRFSLSGAGVVGPVFLRISAPGYLERGTWVDVPASGGPVFVDVIQDAPPFSLSYYRQLARNGHEAPTRLNALVTWTVAPSFYVKTTTEDTGEIVPPDVVEEVVHVLVNSVPALSGRRWEVGTVEQGSETRPITHGWVNVLFFRDVQGAIGRATIGGNQGYMELTHDPDRGGAAERRSAGALAPTSHITGCHSFAADIAEHEVMHTMGLAHTDDVSGDFYTPDCSGSNRSERVLHHAAVAYSRPCGNMDEDVDRANLLSRCARDAMSRVVVQCSLSGGVIR